MIAGSLTESQLDFTSTLVNFDGLADVLELVTTRGYLVPVLFSYFSDLLGSSTKFKLAWQYSYFTVDM